MRNVLLIILLKIRACCRTGGVFATISQKTLKLAKLAKLVATGFFFVKVLCISCGYHIYREVYSTKYWNTFRVLHRVGEGPQQ